MNRRQMLEKLVPEARIVVAHGLQSRRDVKPSGQDRLRFTLNTADLAQRVLRIREIRRP